MIDEFFHLEQMYRTMYTARQIDLVEQALVKKGHAFFHVSGAGHEAMAALAFYLQPEDYLHLHYRDKALLIARGVLLTEFFKSSLATLDSHSAGRQMSAHLSWPELNIASMVGPVGNNALHAAGAAAAIKQGVSRPIAVCTVGDGTTQQGEFLEAVAEAARSILPVLFIVEDNEFSISTRTNRKTFFNGPNGQIDSIFGIQIQRFDGSIAEECLKIFSSTVQEMRNDRKPQILVGEFARLYDHTNSDDQKLYRTREELEVLRSKDPIDILEHRLIRAGYAKEFLETLRTGCERDVENARRSAYINSASIQLNGLKAEMRDRPKAGKTCSKGIQNRHRTMRDSINTVLKELLEGDRRVILQGQDIEDPKGDVFGLTKGLSTAFPHQVLNAPLSESTIVGTSIGRSLAGQKPIAFIQFADFLPLAANQIIAELSTMYWRTNGGWNSPVVVMAPIGGYKPGLGPFHSESYEALFAQCPGLNICVPSNAADAANLLRSAFFSDQPSLFLYPKALLNKSDSGDPARMDEEDTSLGKARIARRGDCLTVVCWGSAVSICTDVADRLAQDKISIEVIDLRCIAPWDKHAVCESARRTGSLIIVHEDRKLMGFGAEIAAYVAENVAGNLKIQRVGREATYLPFNYEQQLSVLPSFRSVMDTCLKLLGIEAEWQAPVAKSADHEVLAIGSGPADDTVQVVEINVSPGDLIREGDLLATVEATKAAVEIRAHRDGLVSHVACRVGDRVTVGDALVFLDPQDNISQSPGLAALKVEHPRVSILTRSARRSPNRETPSFTVEIRDVEADGGARIVTTQELCASWPNRNYDDLIRVTGIVSRRWLSADQTLLGVATAAARKLLDRNGLEIRDIGLVIATTGTPDVVTPSMASRICACLSTAGEPPPLVAAYDINAACSGYLFALQAACDFLLHNPSKYALVITAEALSQVLNLEDPDTASLFGDAVTATLLSSSSSIGQSWLKLERPIISGKPDIAQILRVPLKRSGYIEMNGRAVFSEAVKSLTWIAERACEYSGKQIADLCHIIPHQANQRILDAIQQRSGIPVMTSIREWGNTSSSSIPLTLAVCREALRPGDTFCLVAFGGGLTSAASIGRVER